MPCSDQLGDAVHLGAPFEERLQRCLNVHRGCRGGCAGRGRGSSRRARAGAVASDLEVVDDPGPDLVHIQGLLRVDRGHAVVGGDQDERPLRKAPARPGSVRGRLSVSSMSRSTSAMVGPEPVHRGVDVRKVDEPVAAIGLGERAADGADSLGDLGERVHGGAVQQHPGRGTGSDRARERDVHGNAGVLEPRVQVGLRVDVGGGYCRWRGACQERYLRRTRTGAGR